MIPNQTETAWTPAPASWMAGWFWQQTLWQQTLWQQQMYQLAYARA